MLFAEMPRCVWFVLVLCLLLPQESWAAGPSYRKSSLQEIQQMALALSMTSRLNERLNCEGEGSSSGWVSASTTDPNQQQTGVQGKQLRGGGGGGGSTTTISTMLAVRRPSAFVSDASNPTRNMTLETFLGKLFDILHFTELESTLAMIYLDRACSVVKVCFLE